MSIDQGALKSIVSRGLLAQLATIDAATKTYIHPRCTIFILKGIMRDDEQMVFSVPRELKAEFQNAAEVTDRSADQLLREFMHFFVTQYKTVAACAPPSTPEERQAAVNFGASSVRLEGFVVSLEAQAHQQRWVRGEMTIEECIAGIKQAHQRL